MSDLIKREDVQREIQASFDGCALGWQDWQDLMDRINALPTASPWHRVEEEPKDEGKYLVYDGRGNYYVAWWGPRLGWCYDPKFFRYWMPIEPPKEDA